MDSTREQVAARTDIEIGGQLVVEGARAELVLHRVAARPAGRQ